MPPRAEAAGEFRGAAPILIGGAVGMAVQAFAYISLGTMLGPLMASTGWSRTQILAVTPLSALMAPLAAPWVGTLIERYGTRRVACIGFWFGGVAVASLGLIGDRLLGWWLLWIVIAAATYPTGALVWTQLVARGFVGRRGFALGLVLSGMGMGIATVPAAMVWLNAAFGWRGAYGALGGAMILLGSLAAWLATSRTRADVESTTVSHAQWGLTRSAAMRTVRFWHLGAILFLASGVVGVVSLHLQGMMTDRGMSAIAAAAVLGVFGPAQITGRLGGGWLLDRVHGRILGSVVFAAPLIGSISLLSGGRAGSWLTAASFGISAGLELDLGSYLASRYFGTRHFASIFSAIFVFHVIGYTLAPLAAAQVRDLTGSYAIVLDAVIVTLVALIVLCAWLGRYPADRQDA